MTNSNPDNRTSNDYPPPLPTAQDAGKTAVNPEVQTRPPVIPPPLTSSTGTGFNAPDAGTTLPASDIADRARDIGRMLPTTPDVDMPQPQPGDIDRDALVGEEDGPGSQAGAEPVSSTGPVSG